jgi:hypothetical protein
MAAVTRRRAVHVPNPADPDIGDRFIVDHPDSVVRGSAPSFTLHRARHGQRYTVIGRDENLVGTRIIVRFDGDHRAKTVSWPVTTMRHDIPEQHAQAAAR